MVVTVEVIVVVASAEVCLAEALEAVCLAVASVVLADSKSTHNKKRGFGYSEASSFVSSVSSLKSVMPFSMRMLYQVMSFLM